MPDSSATDGGPLKAPPASCLSLRQKMLLVAVLGQLLTTAVGGSAWLAMQGLNEAHRETVKVGDALRLQQHGDMMHDALRGDVYRSAFAGAHGEPREVRDAIRDEAIANASAFRQDIDAISTMGLAAGPTESIAAVRPQLEAYIQAALDALATETPASDATLAAFEERFQLAATAQEDLTRALTRAQAERAEGERDAEHDTLVRIAVSAVLALAVLLGVTTWLGRSLVRSLGEVGAMARRVVGGDLKARAHLATGDEVGQLAGAFNEMADSLTGFVERLAAEAEREGFGSELAEALEMADEEEGVTEVVERAMQAVEPDVPMELLLADSSRANLERAAISRSAGGAGCPVKSPYSCPAVRKGSPVVFSDSDALGACPILRSRAGGRCSAVCIPVSFMGRSLGVLHAAGPPDKPVSAEHVAQLTTLATQAGARIGTVRAFRKTQLQASTDGLTGLLNRRSFENEVRTLLAAKRPFAIAMADLDRFKQLNDTFGHEAGDRALRTFSRVLKQTVRADDIVARFGGEEFVFVFPDLDRDGARLALERVRAALAAAQSADNPAFTSSFGATDSTFGTTVGELLRIADAALYQAKANGRDRVETGPGDVAPTATAPTATAPTERRSSQAPSIAPPVRRMAKPPADLVRLIGADSIPPTSMS